jgi:Xaa-Pro aminopeptidase
LVPKAEIQSRIERFQKWLEAEALDGAFLLQHVDIFYFSGTLQRSILFVPASGQPLLMVMKSVQRAINESSLKEVLPLGGRDALPSLLADFNHASLERVGLELDVLPTAQYLWFKNKFPQMQIVDVSPGIRTLRMIKSPYEIDQIRQSAAILDKGYQQIRGLIREGMPALEIDGLLFSMGNEIRPGMTCRAIYDKAKAIAGKRGVEDHFMGHGEGQVRFLGLEIDEMPVIAPKFKMPVEEGMVFALEPKFSFPGLGIVGIEDDYLVTAQGLHRLTLTEQKLLQISGGPAPV